MLHRGTGHMHTRIALLASALTVVVTVPAAAGTTRFQARPQTLVTVSREIEGFAQDGSQVGWLTSAIRKGQCLRNLWVQSPDGRTIAFATSRNDIVDDDQLPTYELFLIGADGTAERPLTFRVPASWATPGELRTAAGRKIVSFEAYGTTRGVAFAGRGRSAQQDTADRAFICLISPTTGAQVESALVPGSLTVMVGATPRWVVYLSRFRTIRVLDVRSMQTRVLTVAPVPVLGLSVSGRRVAWAENFTSSSHRWARVRAVTLP